MPGRIDQVLAGFALGDAISGEAVMLQDILRAQGNTSDIFVDARHLSPKMKQRARPMEEYDGSPADVLIHHYSIASPVVDLFQNTKARKVMIYHNITPSHFYTGFDDCVAAQLAEARDGMRALLPHMDAIWADSNFNAGELRDMGARDVKVLPLLFSPQQIDLPSEPAIMDRFSVPMTNFLCVGRLAPNKHVEGVIAAFAWYHRTINRHSRLIIVGSDRSAWRYFTMLQMYAAECDMQTVYFERHATATALAAHYRLADAFVTCSQHEGYCLPLVEAMHHNVPVIARRQGGMPEALGGGGVMFEDAGPRELAVLMDRVVSDQAFRAEVLESQNRRMEIVRARRVDEELKELLTPLR